MLFKIISLLVQGISETFILQCLISISLGGFISFSLIASGQKWAKSFSNITTFCILPLIGLVITSVISGNIALSLGMVGALSIIRFRHPVKSPLELSIYFLLLTVGITITSSIGKAIVLTIFCMTIIYSYSYYRNREILKNMGTFDYSLSGEEPSYILEIYSSEKKDYLAKNDNLLFSNEDKFNKNYIYKLCFEDKYKLNKVKEYIEELPGIKEIKFSKI